MTLEDRKAMLQQELEHLEEIAAVYKKLSALIENTKVICEESRTGTGA